MNKLDYINQEIKRNKKPLKSSLIKSFILSLLLRYNILRLNVKVYFVNKRINKNKGASMTTQDRLTQIKADLVGALDQDKGCCLLVTVPDIGIRDYFLADPLFKNFYSNRVSFREKKVKKNKMMLCLIERI